MTEDHASFQPDLNREAVRAACEALAGTRFSTLIDDRNRPRLDRQEQAAIGTVLDALDAAEQRVKALEGALACLDGDREIKPLDGDRLERLLDFEERWACVCPSSDASLSWPDQRALLNEAVLAFRSREALAALNPTGEP